MPQAMTGVGTTTEVGQVTSGVSALCWGKGTLFSHFIFSHVWWGQSLLTAHSPKILTLAAAEQANQEGNDDNSTNHCEGDYQRLEIHCRCTQRDMTAKVFKNPQWHVNWMTEILSYHNPVFCCETSGLNIQLKAFIWSPNSQITSQSELRMHGRCCINPMTWTCPLIMSGTKVWDAILFILSQAFRRNLITLWTSCTTFTYIKGR